jgi:hypothetical protein
VHDDNGAIANIEILALFAPGNAVISGIPLQVVLVLGVSATCNCPTVKSDVTLTVFNVMLALGLVMVSVAVVVPPSEIVADDTVVTTVGANVLVPSALANKLKLLPMMFDSTKYCPLICPAPDEVKINGMLQLALGAIGVEQLLKLLLSGGAEVMLEMLTGAPPTLCKVTSALEIAPAGVGPGITIVPETSGANQPPAGETVVPLNVATAVWLLMVMPKFASLRPTGWVKGKK